MQMRHTYTTAVFFATVPVAFAAQAAVSRENIASTALDLGSDVRVRKLCSGYSINPDAAQVLCRQLDDAERPIIDQIGSVKKELEDRHASDPTTQQHCRELADKKQKGEFFNRAEEGVAKKCTEITEAMLRLQGNMSTLSEIRADFEKQHQDDILVLEGKAERLPPPMSIVPVAAEMPATVAAKRPSSATRKNFVAAKQSLTPAQAEFARAFDRVSSWIFNLVVGARPN